MSTHKPHSNDEQTQEGGREEGREGGEQRARDVLADQEGMNGVKDSIHLLNGRLAFGQEVDKKKASLVVPPSTKPHQ